MTGNNMTILEQRFMEMVPNQLRDICQTLKVIADSIKAQTTQTVWVFTAEQASCGSVEDTIVKAFPTEEAAQEYMHSFIYEDGDETIAAYVKRNGWEVEMDEPDLYRAYGEDYCTDHVECTISKCETT